MKGCVTDVAPKTLTRVNGYPRVLAVSNHWGVPKGSPINSIFVDRQLNSLKNAGVEISIFDIGASYSPFKLFRQLLQLRKEVRKLNPDLVHSQYGTIRSFLSTFSGRPTVISFCGKLITEVRYLMLKLC